MKRRDFLGAALMAGVSPRLNAQAPAEDDRIAQPTGAGYDSATSDRSDQPCWVQVDLGSPRIRTFRASGATGRYVRVSEMSC
jgi:hypothetical protein